MPSRHDAARRAQRGMHTAARAGNGLQGDRDLHGGSDGHGERAEHQLDPLGVGGDRRRHRRAVGLGHLRHPQLAVPEPVGGDGDLEVGGDRPVEPLPKHHRQPHRRGKIAHSANEQTGDPMDALEAIMTTRAMRRFSDRPVADADIEMCLPRRPTGALRRQRPAPAVRRAHRPRPRRRSSATCTARHSTATR